MKRFLAGLILLTCGITKAQLTVIPQTTTINNVPCSVGSNCSIPLLTSVGKSVAYYLDDTNIVPTGTGPQNAYQVNTLTKTPVTATARQLDNIACTAATSPCLVETYLYNLQAGTTSIPAGTWVFNDYAFVSSTVGGRVSSLRHVIAKVTPYITNITMTSVPSSTSRTATAASGTPFAVANIGAGPWTDASTAPYLQTPNGLFMITSRTSDTVVLITTLSTYTNEAPAASYSVWVPLFSTDSATITQTTTEALIQTYSAQAAFTIAATDKLGYMPLAVVNNITTVSFTHNGNSTYSYFITPLIDTNSGSVGATGLLRFFGDGSDGDVTCSGNYAGGVKWVSSFTVALGATCTLNVIGSQLEVHSTGACTIAGTINGRGVDAGNSASGQYGGGGGGGGGGAASGVVGATSSQISQTHSAGGALGTAGNPGGNSTGPTATDQRISLTNGIPFPGGGSSGGAGGSSGPAGARGGQGVVFVCKSINFTGTIDVSGNTGGNSTNNNIGASGGGGGGIVVLSAESYVASSGTITVAGGSGGSCLAFTGCGAGGNGGNGWSALLTIK